jgi:hypothetical protein
MPIGPGLSLEPGVVSGIRIDLLAFTTGLEGKLSFACIACLA